MTAKEAIETMRRVLNTPVAMPGGGDDSTERLVRAVTCFISLPAALQSEIGMEAISRQARAGAAGKKPWEIAP
jgi:hypothetical protein